MSTDDTKEQELQRDVDFILASPKGYSGRAFRVARAVRELQQENAALWEKLARAEEELTKLRNARFNVLTRNGGPTEGDDGTPYVLVLEQDFLALAILPTPPATQPAPSGSTTESAGKATNEKGES